MMHPRAGRLRISERRKPTDTAAQANGPSRVDGDLLAFLGVLAFVAGLTLLVDRTGQLSARLGFAGAAGLVAGCVTAWRRLRRPGPRRWRSGQVIYRGRRMSLVSAWGIEGQPPPAIELPAAAEDADGLIGPTALPAAALPPNPED
jgi:hypothetical protein